jgi:hypothetical protein
MARLSLDTWQVSASAREVRSAAEHCLSCRCPSHRWQLRLPARCCFCLSCLCQNIRPPYAGQPQRWQRASFIRQDVQRTVQQPERSVPVRDEQIIQCPVPLGVHIRHSRLALRSNHASHVSPFLQTLPADTSCRCRYRLDTAFAAIYRAPSACFLTTLKRISRYRCACTVVF